MEKTKEAIKKQFNKKRQNSQRLKQGDSVWLEVKKYPIESTLKKAKPKKYKPFEITKNIKQEVFQLKLLEKWAIYTLW